MIDPIKYIAHHLPSGGRCLFMPNGGNLGDALIGWATVQKFEKARINWTFFREQRRSITTDDILVYGGGGSLVPHYRGGIECVKSMLRFGAPVVILPQSCSGHEEFWSETRELTVFCRDFESFNHMRKFPNVTSLLGHDMAIDLDLTENPLATSIAIQRATASSGGRRILFAFRRDEEAVQPPAAGSIDLSAVTHPQMTNIISLVGNACSLLAAVACYTEVHTDRLHVAIAAALLEVPTILRDNSYGKNRAVYEASLKQRFPIIKFEEAADG